MILISTQRFFLHERGFWMGAYFTFYFSGAFLGPIMSGNIAAKHGWRSFFWLSVGLATFVTLLLCVAFPETKWQRNSVNHAGLLDAHRDSPSRDEKVDQSEVGSDDGAGGMQVGRGKPNARQFSPVQKPDRNWM